MINLKNILGYKYLFIADISEELYLLNNIETSPSAQLRLGYLLFQQEKDQYTPAIQRFSNEYFKALKVDRPVGPFWSNKVLNDNQKKEYWEKVKDKLDALNVYTFNAEAKNFTDRNLGIKKGDKFYQLIKNINEDNILEKR